MGRMESEADARETLRSGLRRLDVAGARVLLIVPDATRTVPLPWFVREIMDELGERVEALDIMVALGTHQPMSDAALAAHLGVSVTDGILGAPVHRSPRGGRLQSRVYNHSWNDPAAIAELGALSREEICALSGGRLDEELPVTLNARALGYDRLLILSPVFPHELVGLSGGYKYLFPGISGREIIDLTHWLAALTGNLASIGKLRTPARDVIHAAAGLVPVPASAICAVIGPGREGAAVEGIYVGDVLDAWNDAARHSQAAHIRRTPHPYRSVLACALGMYDDLWTGGKAIYKCEPIVEPGGELIVYAPHITSVSVTHEANLLACGYHCIDYFLDHLAELADVPRMILGVASYVYGAGTWDGAVERPRMRVRLATGIPEETCRRMGLEYVDPASIDPADWQGREDDGLLHVEKAGETLYRLEADE